LIVEETIVITGATAGIGLACARQLIAQGHRVVGIGRRQERLDALHDELGNGFYPLACDIRQNHELQERLQALPEPFRQFSKLINSAGLLQGQGSFLDVTPTQVTTMLETNISGLLNVTRAVLPQLIASGRGHIVNLS